MKLGSSRGMDTKRPRGSERSKPCHQLRLTRRSLPPYPWPPEQAQPGVSKPCRTTLAHYLATGHAEGRGTAAGPMGEAVDLSLVHLTSEDIAAMVAYLRTAPPIANPNLPAPKPSDAIAAQAPGASG